MDSTGLSKILSYAEENVSEGDYLKIAKALKSAYEMKDPEVMKVFSYPLNIRISCVSEEMAMEITNYTMTIMVGQVPNKYSLSYTYITKTRMRIDKTVQWEGSNNPIYKILYRFLVLSNSMDVIVYNDDMPSYFNYKETLQKRVKEYKIQIELEEWDEEENNESVTDIDSYHSVISATVKEIIENQYI